LTSFTVLITAFLVWLNCSEVPWRLV